MTDSSVSTKTKKKSDAKKKAELAKRKEKEIKTDIFEEEYKFQWINHH